MNTVSFEIQSLYGDHHVSEIRRLLLLLDGIEEVYASSAFQMVEVTYNPEKVNDLQIAMKLDEAGYLGEWSIPEELGFVEESRIAGGAFTRHTAVFETINKGMSFSQKVDGSSRPLWNCPGMGVMTKNDLLKKMEE